MNLLTETWTRTKRSAASLVIAVACLPLSTTAAAPDAAADTGGESSTLPLTELILYSSGVGFFHREGEVTGQTRVELRFKTDEINDLLKSMVVQDLSGGRVTAVSYTSRDPLERTLKSFGLDLTSNPGLGQLLNQLRGERVEIMRPGPLAGRLLGVERKSQPVDDDKQVEIEFVNLVTDDGLQSIPLPQVERIKILNERLNAELQQALVLLATSHDTQKKTVAIEFDGEGKRQVSVSYIGQTPVWKTSYRLVLSDTDEPFLQGWAIVENTSDVDWNNVRMSLVSGRPLSFVMDLYQPLYTTRPVIEPELYSSLRPPVYGDAIGEELAQAQPEGSQFYFRRNETLARDALGVQAGTAPAAAAMVPSLASRPASRRLVENRASQVSVTSAAQGIQTGELFEYHITAPVTLARQQSAMLPIINQKVAADKIAIYNESVQPKHPLNGLRLRNSTSSHLMQGPVTVFDAGAYAGDARIDDLAPGQERLLSYALDLKTEVEPVGRGIPQELVGVQIRRGTLAVTRKATDEKTYRIRNRDTKAKTVLIEHPYRSDWTLVSPESPSERSREVYRFAVNVNPDELETLNVREERMLSEQIELSNVASGAIHVYLRSKNVSSKVKAALQRVITLRDRLYQTTAERTRHEARVREIAEEQSRIRENMAKLSPNSELYTRYVKKLDQQESELEQIRREIDELQKTEQKQQRELDEYLLNLDLE